MCILFKQIVPGKSPSTFKMRRNNFFWKQPIILFPKLDDFFTNNRFYTPIKWFPWNCWIEIFRFKIDVLLKKYDQRWPSKHALKWPLNCPNESGCMNKNFVWQVCSVLTILKSWKYKIMQNSESTDFACSSPNISTKFYNTIF